MRKIKRILGGFGALLVAGCIWIPCLHFFFSKAPSEFHATERLSPQAQRLSAWHLRLWDDSQLREGELRKMRASNAEWDFMGRGFLVWSLANMGLREPARKAAYLETMDRIIDETLYLEKTKGMYFFLMPYAKWRDYTMDPAHSLFLDGEIAMMLASRRMLEEKADYKPLLTERVEGIVARFKQSPHLMLESYPEECWMFDHVVALDAIRMADRLDGTDHTMLISEWLAMARKKLVHEQSGLLVSSFTPDGTALDGPEGSSIWMVAHGLQILDANFAEDQYRRARAQLGATTLGFGYAHEWPASWDGPADVDSGPIFPFFKISPGSSGMAFIGASAFEDGQYLSSLAASLDFAGFPSQRAGRLRYFASNQVGDAALLYAATLGPLWQKVKAGGKL
jgi:hypothetical protein